MHAHIRQDKINKQINLTHTKKKSTVSERELERRETEKGNRRKGKERNGIGKNGNQI